MSAITHAHAFNTPLATGPTTRPSPSPQEAILSRLQHFATNGPQYVQFQATRSLARIVGLFDRTSDAIRELGFGPSDQSESEQPDKHPNSSRRPAKTKSPRRR